MSLWEAENDDLRVVVNEDASAEIRDKRGDQRWSMGRVALQEDNPVDIGHVWVRTTRSICEQYPARFVGERLDDAGRLRFSVIGRERRQVGRFTVEMRLDGPWWQVRITEIDEALPSLAFPPALDAASLVAPVGVGLWQRQPLSERVFWPYGSRLNMRWFGGLAADADHGWIAIWDEGVEDAGALATGFAMTPLWLKVLGRWTGARALRYGFTRGGYVGQAKVFRAYAVARGLFRSLRDKIAENPAVGHLHGGRLLSIWQADSAYAERHEDRLQPIPPDLPAPGDNPRVYTSHAEAAQMIATAREWGATTGYVVLRGWINGGYDERHPDVWPPEPKLGSLDEFRALLATPDPFVVAPHDNYQDIYLQSPSWPGGVLRLPNGDPVPGGIWAGGQAYILNSRDGLAYARRNWPLIAGAGPRAMFIDTTIAVQLYQSYERGNELTRAQDLAYKCDLLRLYKDAGQVLGSEEGADFGMTLVDWIEGRHRRVAGQSIPLWPLVYHDAAFYVRYTGGSTPADWLPDLLWGYPLLWALRGGTTQGDDWRAGRERFVQSLSVDRWHQTVGLDAMLDHRYLSEDGQVEQTTFESASIIVNFAADERMVDGQTVAGGGYLVRR